MLSKIISIKSIGRFEDYSAIGDVVLKRFNLVFAENGRGKSTLCAILRSAQSGNPDYVTGRRTLGSTDPPQVQLLTASGGVTFSAGSWSGAMPPLAIFDSTFVADNVYSGEVVDLDQKRNLYRVIIGNAGVILVLKVNDLDAEIRTLNSVIANKRANIVGRLPSGFEFNDFLKLESDPDINTKIAEGERELEAAQQKTQLRARGGLSQVTVPGLPVGIPELLERTIAGLSTIVAQRVATHIAKHRMEENGEVWLQEGLDYIRDGSCPFCDQSLEGVNLVTSLSAFFGEAYQKLKTEIAGMRDRIANDFSDRAIGEAERVIEANAASVEFWARYIQIAPPVLSSPQGFGGPLRELRDAALALFEKKTATPLEIVQIDHRFNNALNVVTALSASASEYNQAESKVQAAIADKKKSLENVNPVQMQRDLLRLRATNARHTPEAARVCNEYKAAMKQKKKLEDDKEAARKELDQHTATVIATYEKTINKLLKDFQAGFRITGTKHAYPGGTPSSSFQILINEVAVDIGDAKSSLKEPSFRNTLSAGDKGTLALAFFLAQFEHDPDKAKRVLIFDDPFNSQDSFRKEHTVQRIRRCGEACMQVVVLSHDRSFLRRLHDHLNQRGLETKCLQLARTGERRTRILPWDIEEATQSQHETNLTALSRFYNAAEGSPAEISAKMRIVLETHCRSVYPNMFGKDDKLGTICEKIRNAGPGHELAPFYDDIDSINEYSRECHHGERPGAPARYIDATELQGYVEKTLSIVGYC